MSNETASYSAGNVLSCSLPDVTVRDLSHIRSRDRARLIVLMMSKWVNGTNLTYFFFKEPVHWRGAIEQENVVREAFNIWKNAGIGLNFQEVDSPESAMIRIGFDFSPNSGSWSYIGRDCIDLVKDPLERTTNFGWDLTTPYGKDTALHEIGHILGFPHEHQNPQAGIVWDEEAVYRVFGGSPNNWPREVTYRNIIQKLPLNSIDGSIWDKNSVMHYQFQKGLIIQPDIYQSEPLIPSSGLSVYDVQAVTKMYPVQQINVDLKPFESQRVSLDPGGQIDFNIVPGRNREYTLETFGEMDTVMVLFEERNGVRQFIAGDDDGGQDFNAKIVAFMKKGVKYVLSIRLYYSNVKGEGVILVY